MSFTWHPTVMIPRKALPSPLLGKPAIINCRAVAKILVQPGAFLGDQRVVLSVQNTCPGPNGELYVTVECSGAHVQDCIVDGQGGAAFDVQSSNWLIKHFTATSNVHGTGNGYGACFSAPSDPAHAAAVHHMLFVDIYAHDCVWSGSSSQGDYIAWLGVVLYHSAFQNHDGGLPVEYLDHQQCKPRYPCWSASIRQSDVQHEGDESHLR